MMLHMCEARGAVQTVGSFCMWRHMQSKWASAGAQPAITLVKRQPGLTFSRWCLAQDVATLNNFFHTGRRTGK